MTRNKCWSCAPIQGCALVKDTHERNIASEILRFARNDNGGAVSDTDGSQMAA